MARIMNGDRQIPVVGELGTGTAANVMNVVGGGRPGIQRWGPLGTNEKNIEGESDGWEFWSRVYSNPVLKQQMDEKAQNEPSISQLLQQEHLCQAELIFLNVPRLAHEQKGAIKQLIEKEVGGGNVPMLDIQIAPKRWRLRFYRSADAHRVMQHLNGFIYRGKALMVHYSPSTTAVPLENDSEVSSGDRANDLNGGRQYHRSTPFHQQPFDYDAFEGKSVIDLEIAKNKPSIWSDVELHDMKNFELDLVHYVSTHDGSLLHSALAALSHRKGVASAAIDLWPTAFVRLFHPKVNLVGRYLTVNSSHTAYLLKKASMESVSRASCESWETMSAMGVRTEVQLVDYVTAFLTHFGPQHLTIDVPVRLLCKCLPSMWPHTPTELAEKLAKLSPHFLVVNDVLFLSSNARHRRSLVDSLQLVNLSVQNLPKIFSMLLSNSHLHAHPNHIPPPSSLHPNISHHRRFAL